MINIENSLICSVLEHDFILNDEKIIKHTLEPKIFSDTQNKRIVIAINRLKELKEPISTDTLIYRISKAGKFDSELEERLSEIITCNPFGTYELFLKYYKYIETESRKKEIIKSIYI